MQFYAGICRIFKAQKRSVKFSSTHIFESNTRINVTRIIECSLANTYGGRDLCHQDGKSPMGEPDDATECLRKPSSVDSLQRTTPDNMDPATQLNLGGTREGHDVWNQWLPPPIWLRFRSVDRCRPTHKRLPSPPSTVHHHHFCTIALSIVSTTLASQPSLVV